MFVALGIFMMVFSSVDLYWVFDTNNLTVGILSFEDYYLFAYAMEKPWGKLFPIVLGVFVGWFFTRL